MFDTSDHFIRAEHEYRRDLARRTAADSRASRAGRARSSWLRRLAAGDKSVS